MFGRTLKELREAKNLSMDKLVELYNQKFDAKMNKSTLSRYENGIQDPIYTVVVNLAKLFDVSVDYLLGQTDSAKKVKRTETDALKDNTIVYRKDGQTTEVELPKDKLNIVLKMIDALKDEDNDL